MKDWRQGREFLLLAAMFFPSGVQLDLLEGKKSRGKKASGRSGPRERAGSGLFWGAWEDLRPHTETAAEAHTFTNQGTWE